MMIFHFRPKRVIEIGSGFSSACILDSVQHANLRDFHLTCIEPNVSRLRSLLRPEDSERLTLIEAPVQDVPCAIVDALEPNDILFIDSTHVMKTGSDVHYEFFHLLPRLKPGVILHFHDIQYPFEYPDGWIFDSNYSWNEAYVLRAFLMFNKEFSIIFWNALYAGKFTTEITNEFPTFLNNPGGSIWIERVAA
jgi:predicted O-methyltransferase YrrM